MHRFARGCLTQLPTNDHLILHPFVIPGLAFRVPGTRTQSKASTREAWEEEGLGVSFHGRHEDHAGSRFCIILDVRQARHNVGIYGVVAPASAQIDNSMPFVGAVPAFLPVSLVVSFVPIMCCFTPSSCCPVNRLINDQHSTC